MEQLDGFLAHFSDLHGASHRTLVEIFGYFLTEVLGEDSVRVSRVKECYDHARLPAPGNISDVMRKSGSFVRTEFGLQLHRTAKTRIEELLQPKERSGERGTVESKGGHMDKTRNVVVIYGRDRRLRDGMFNFLRTLHLNPLEWEDAVKATGKGSPYTGEIVGALRACSGCCCDAHAG